MNILILVTLCKLAHFRRKFVHLTRREIDKYHDRPISRIRFRCIDSTDVTAAAFTEIHAAGDEMLF